MWWLVTLEVQGAQRRYAIETDSAEVAELQAIRQVVHILRVEEDDVVIVGTERLEDEQDH